MLDPLFYRRLRYVTDEYRRQRKLHNDQQLQQRMLLSAIARALLGADVKETLRNELIVARGVFELTYGYTPETPEELQQRAADAMTLAWGEVFGDPKDPAVKARIEAAAAELLRRSQAAPRENWPDR